MSAYFDTFTNTLYISAYELCSYVLRGGSVDNAMEYGNKAGCTVVSHRLHESKPNIVDAYTYSTVCEGYNLTVYTYPEGIRKEDNGVYTVEKVYTVPYSLDKIENGELDIAINTAICSSHIVMHQLGGNYVETRVVYFGEKHDEERTFGQRCYREEANVCFENLVEMLSPFVKIIGDRHTKCLPQLKSLHFPFKDVRESQREFILDTFRAIRTHKRLIVQAPTGTGKTMASVYPAIKSIGEGYADKVFYLTGKATTAYAAINAIDIMRESIPDFRAIHISSKEKCCKSTKIKDRRKCKNENCTRSRGFYDKINLALAGLLQNYRTYTMDIIDAIAEKYSICSYELSLELSEWCELIVCDYNYLFDLQVYFRRYFGAVDANYVFLIDEAHNLPDRAREMYSATLTRSDFARIENKFPKFPKFARACGDVLSKFDVLHALAMTEKQEIEDELYGFYITSELPEDITAELTPLVKTVDKMFATDFFDEELNELYFNVKHMLKVCEIFDKRFKMYIEAHNEEVILRLLCLDASYMLDKAMKKGISTVLFSATLTPLEYFSDILGCGKSTTLDLKSPYAKENLCLIGINNISTRYEDRKKSATNVANVIRASIAGKKGNYIVYFPSYSYLTEVKEIFENKYPKIKVITQIKSMSEGAKREFLDSFDDKCDTTQVGFCVMGGSFSEGIDLKGERLIGAIIVGVGLPTISSELNIIKEHFDNTRENGYAYAYTYPGMNKVLQAAGRVIRSENERGVVVLIDDRFATEEYKMIMPEYWHHIKYLNNANDLLKEVTLFWKK